EKAQHWDSRGHFFAAAAQAMRRILIDNARRKQADKHGGGWRRHDLLDAELAIDSTGDELFAVDAALSQLATREPVIARLVELRFFAGLTLEEAAECLGIAQRTAYRHWAYARAWLRREVEALLAAHDRLGHPHPATRDGNLAATVEAPADLEGPGTRIGPYRLLQPIGEGGMGTVFLAEQTKPVQRRVALKVIKPGM